MQLGFYFDQTRCTGCHACAVACKDWNDIPAGPAHWRRIVSMEAGEWPDIYAGYLTTSCSHCAKPICADVCPAGAISKRETDGIVLVDRTKCRQAAPCGIISNAENVPFGSMKSPCTIACPAGVNAQAYIALISKGRFEEALEVIRNDLPLPSVCGRVCTHPCESVCKRQDLDESIAIMALKRFVTDQIVSKPEPLPVTKRQKVAVIGSGPAGLSAAWSLAKRGYSTTVFEALPVAGGMLAVGLPEYRLPRAILKRDLDYLKALGIEIRTNTPIGEHLKLDDLRHQGYEAFFLSIGTHKGHRLSIPGADLDGVYVGITFLQDLNMNRKPEVGDRVLVLGGGRAALDCARSAARLGASEVQIACLEDRDAMRAVASEIEEAEYEGITFHNAQSFKRILENNGHVSGVECLDVRSFSFDDKGQVTIDTLPGSEHLFACDTVIFAVGQSPDLSPFPELLASKAAAISVDPQTSATGLKGVFAGGDVAGEVGSVVEAISAGKRAATSIDAFLQGLVYKGVDRSPQINPAEIEVDIPPDVKEEPRQIPSALSLAKRRSWDEVSLGYKPHAAVSEARRCFNCAGHLCREVCPYDAPQFDAEQNATMQMCNLCVDRWGQDKKPVCVMACPMRAMDAGPVDELNSKYGDEREAEGFSYSKTTDPSVCFKPKKYQP
jgi:NADPH-dependent glutamate synthase beta subunit-like oxidoreductase